MAKFKKTGGKRKAPDAPTQAEQLSRKLSESAQQVWLAGVGAFGRAQAEGSRLFEALVRDGMNVEQGARRFAGGRADQVRDAVEARVGQARERASDTWDRLEKVFEERVQRALVKLGVPGRDDLADLARRVDTLTAELRRQGGSAATPRRKATVRKATVRQAPTKKAATRKAAVRKTSAAPATRRPARKSSN
jgi:poly(hydroxyalkanoate) granule-associated protein